MRARGLDMCETVEAIQLVGIRMCVEVAHELQLVARALKQTEVEDFACGWVLFENGARLVYKTCWCMNMDSLGGTIFLGTKAGLRIGVGEVRGPQEGVTLYGDEGGKETTTSIPIGASVDVFKAEDSAFVDAVREGKPSPINPDGMLLTNVIIQGVIDSQAKGGREVKVKVPIF